MLRLVLLVSERRLEGFEMDRLHQAIKTLHKTGKKGDWATLTSRAGAIKAPVKVMEGVNDKTVWTWNAIGKRRGAWNLSEDAKEATDGFLLNHLIDDLLPEQAGGYRYANADPVTGQAAWYDLRVRVERTENPPPASLPDTGTQKSPVGQGPETVRFGEE